MKRFTLFLATLLGVCGAYAQEATEWPIEPKNEYVEYMLYLENEDARIMGDKGLSIEMAQMMMGLSDECATPEQLVEGVDAMYKEVETVWRKFVWLCNEERYEEAIELYRSDPLMVDLALSHTMIRYTFHYDVLGFILYDYLPTEEARKLIIDAISLDCLLLGYHYAETGDEAYGEYFDESYYLLKELYIEQGEYQSAIDLIDVRAQFLNAESMSAGQRGSMCVSKAEMYYAMGDVRKAYDLLVEGGALLNEELLIDSDNEELKEAIAQVDELIEFTSKCL